MSSKDSLPTFLHSLIFGVIFCVFIYLFCTEVLHLKEAEERPLLQEKHYELRNAIDNLKTQVDTLQNVVNAAMDRMEAQKEVSTVVRQGDWYMTEGEATAYSPFENVSGIEADENPLVTATGKKPGPGRFAIDPRRIPYGSEIIVILPDGSIEQGIAEDTGGALRSNHRFQVDLFRQTYKEANRFGRQEVTILWRPKEE